MVGTAADALALLGLVLLIAGVWGINSHAAIAVLGMVCMSAGIVVAFLKRGEK